MLAPAAAPTNKYHYTSVHELLLSSITNALRLLQLCCYTMLLMPGLRLLCLLLAARQA
jgi:hypothetical protein